MREYKSITKKYTDEELSIWKDLYFSMQQKLAYLVIATGESILYSNIVEL